MYQELERCGRINDLRQFPRIVVAVALVLMIAGSGFSQEASRPNILFIIVDDLRPELGCYGNTVDKTPHIDRFAKGALLAR